MYSCRYKCRTFEKLEDMQDFLNNEVDSQSHHITQIVYNCDTKEYVLVYFTSS